MPSWRKDCRSSIGARTGADDNPGLLLRLRVGAAHDEHSGRHGTIDQSRQDVAAAAGRSSRGWRFSLLANTPLDVGRRMGIVPQDPNR